MVERSAELKTLLDDSTRNMLEEDSKIFKDTYLAEFSKAMKIYDEFFDFKIVKDTLILSSQNAIIHAERVRPLTELLEEVF